MDEGTCRRWFDIIESPGGPRNYTEIIDDGLDNDLDGLVDEACD